MDRLDLIRYRINNFIRLQNLEPQFKRTIIEYFTGIKEENLSICTKEEHILFYLFKLVDSITSFSHENKYNLSIRYMVGSYVCFGLIEVPDSIKNTFEDICDLVTVFDLLAVGMGES